MNTAKNDFIRKEQLKMLRYSYKQQLKALRKYYSDKGLSMIGLNGIEENDYLFHKGLLQSLATLLSTDESETVIIDGFSTILNEVEDIKYLLDSNPSVADLKNLRMYSRIRLLEDQMQQRNMPKFLGKLGYINGVLNPIRRKDENTKLTNTLKESTEPIIIYASGVDDLFVELNSDPFKFCDDYINNISEYKYTLDKINNHEYVKKVITSIDESFKNILSYNNNISLFAIGANTHITGYSDELQLFKQVIREYNRELEKLCEKYGFDYVPSYGSLTYEILERLYDKKIWNPENKCNPKTKSDRHINDNGLYNVFVELKRELSLLYTESNEPDFVKQERRLVLRRKINVVKNVLMKKV